MHPRGYFSVRPGSARRVVMAMTGLALALGTLPVLAGAVRGTTAVASVAARADDVTASQDTLRTGWDQNEANMGPSVVPTFVQRFRVTVGGQVYAQPLVIHSLNMVVVATENDWVYGLDATTGAVIWQNHLGNAMVIAKAPTSNTKLKGCGDLTPNIGITGTPVYDPSSGTVYFFANILSGTTPNYYLVGINPSSQGTVVTKILISGHPTNDSHISFNPIFEQERPGTLLLNGGVYGTFASHCDVQPYTGYVVRVDLAAKTASLWASEAQTSDSRAGIWMSGAGVMADPQGRIFVTTGNGISPPKTNTPPGTLAESVVRLGWSGSKLSAQDFFSPANAPSLDSADTDFGSGGPSALPFGTASGSASQMLVETSKDGRVWLLNRGGLGGREQGSGSTDNALFWTKAYGGQWSHAAMFADTTTISNGTDGTANDFVFTVGKNDPLRVFRVAITPTGKPVLTNVGNSSLTYDFTSGSPVVTSNGTDPNSVVIWEVHASNNTGAGGELDAYAPGKMINGSSPSTCTSSSQCTMTPIWHATFGSTNAAGKFSIPATDNGWVYVGTRGSGTAGQVMGYSTPAAGSSVQAAATTVPQATVNTSVSQPVSITANKTVTFSGVTASTGASNALVQQNQYTVGQATVTRKGSATAQPVTFPVTLNKGDKLTVDVTFAPAAPGAANGSLTFTTSDGHTRVVPLTGNGIQTGLHATPSSVSFPLAIDQGVIDVPVGISTLENVNITNGGTSTETVQSVTPPSGAFSATGMPVNGQQITPGESFVVQFTFAPSTPGPASGSFAITTSSGKRLTVALSGIGSPSVSKVNADQSTTAFGSVRVGTSATLYIHITNNGNIPAEVSVPNPPTAPFHSVFQVPAGLPFNPEYDLLIPITFSPTRTGTFSQPYKLVWTDRLGTHSLTVKLTGTGI